jgi:hypothetical protein
MQQNGRGDSGPKSVASQRWVPEYPLGRNLPPIASLTGGPASGSHRTIAPIFLVQWATVSTLLVTYRRSPGEHHPIANARRIKDSGMFGVPERPQRREKSGKLKNGPLIGLG